MTSPASQLIIRPMSAADLPHVMDCAGRLEHAPHYSRSTWLAMLDPQTTPPRLLLVATDESGKLHGFAVAGRLGPQAELESIAVDPASQRRGIGRRLLDEVIGELRRTGVEELWLEVRESNHPAAALYRAAGFRQAGRRPRYYANPVEDGLLMSLPLA